MREVAVFTGSGSPFTFQYVMSVNGGATLNGSGTWTLSGSGSSSVGTSVSTCGGTINVTQPYTFTGGNTLLIFVANDSVQTYVKQ